MISPKKITAGWLLDGLHAALSKQSPPTGFEFAGLILEPGHDPISQLAERLVGPGFGLAMKVALQEALADTSLYRFGREFAESVMTGLVRLLDYFGSPEANRTLLVKVERGELREASAPLLQRIASVGARQSLTLRRRFEDALLRGSGDLSNGPLALPFIQAEIEDWPESWMDIAVQRMTELTALREIDLNALSLILGSVCADGRDQPILVGLASGQIPEHRPVLELLFGGGEPRAELRVESHGFGETRVTLILDLYDRHLALEDLLSMRPRTEVLNEYDMIAEIERKLAKDDWSDEFQTYIEYAPVQEVA